MFDSNAITPGTRFMTLLANQLRAGLEAAVTQPGAFQGLKVRPPPLPFYSLSNQCPPSFVHSPPNFRAVL